jgi:hypothetical protein
MPKQYETTIVNPADGGKSKVTVQGYEVGDEVMTFNYPISSYEMERVKVIEDRGLVTMSSYDGWVEQVLLVEFPNGDKVVINSGDVTDAPDPDAPDPPF